ncbi:MAG: YbaK/EbsC family protein [Proteobacteria bacterium]|nr:YbaK/EbsC family protein [Pseudomonadota bacterium]
MTPPTGDAAALSPSAQRVQRALVAAGVASTVVEHPVAARTSAEAAAALGCTVAEIAKSLVFRVGDDDAVLVVASGANRVDERKVAAAIGAPIGKADAAFVRTVTGYAIGGIPPLAHARPLRTLIDADLLRFAVVHAAGGTPHAMFGIAPADLIRITGGLVSSIAENPGKA